VVNDDYGGLAHFTTVAERIVIIFRRRAAQIAYYYYYYYYYYYIIPTAENDDDDDDDGNRDRRMSRTRADPARRGRDDCYGVVCRGENNLLYINIVRRRTRASAPGRRRQNFV